MQAARCADYFAAPQDQLEHLRRCDTTAQLNTYNSRGATPVGQVDARRIDQVGHLQHGGRKTHQKAQSLFVWRTSFKLKVFFESHSARYEIEQCSAHAQGSYRDSWNFVRRAQSEHPASDIQREEVEPIEVDIAVGEECIKVLSAQTGVEYPDVKFRIDLAGHLQHHIALASAQGRYSRAHLSIEIRECIAVEVSNRESANSQPRKREQVRPANTTQAGDANPRAFQPKLLCLGHPSKIPAESFIVGKTGAGQSRLPWTHPRQFNDLSPAPSLGSTNRYGAGLFATAQTNSRTRSLPWQKNGFGVTAERAPARPPSTLYGARQVWRRRAMNPTTANPDSNKPKVPGSGTVETKFSDPPPCRIRNPFANGSTSPVVFVNAVSAIA